ncbi:MAG TPA: hypothetical protein VFW33_02505, partial [Gemmataceae bacterium]|nr:hypothetical protein [Gemmataceae bacterium]
QQATQIVGPGTVNNAPTGSAFSFGATVEDGNGVRVYSANATGVIRLVSGPGAIGGSVKVVGGVATVNLTLSAAGTYIIQIDSGLTDGNGVEIVTYVTVNTRGRQT